jgi:hypothetical protein
VCRQILWFILIATICHWYIPVKGFCPSAAIFFVIITMIIKQDSFLLTAATIRRDRRALLRFSRETPQQNEGLRPIIMQDIGVRT